MEDFGCHGFLLKKTPSIWVERYFILHTDGNPRLCSYETEALINGEVEFVFADGTQFEILQLPGIDSYELRLQAGDCTLVLAARESEYRRWSQQLDMAIRVTKREGVSAGAFMTPSTCSVMREDSEHTGLTRRMSSHRIKGKEFIVDDRYECLKPIGQGAYGMVVSCMDTRTGKQVAIKKVSQVFEDTQDARRILRELRLMRSISHPNILSLKDVMEPLEEDFNDLYLTTELMFTDLHKVVKSRQALSENQQQFIMYQLMCGLAHLHDSHIIHRDLKPANILLSMHCELKICDFGLARMQSTETRVDYRHGLTEYVVTRWYRAPEIMLSYGNYDAPVDVWAAGCIFAEMQLSEPLFRGHNSVDQLKMIIKFLGSPSEEDLQLIQRPRVQDFVRRLPRCSPVSLTHQFPRLSTTGRELLRSMLCFRPHSRVTARQAITHAFFNGIRNTEVECLPASFVDTADIESCRLEAPILRAMMAQEINHMKRKHATSEPTSPEPTAVEQTPTEPTTASTDSSSRGSFHGEGATAPQPARRPSVRGWLQKFNSMYATALAKASRMRGNRDASDHEDEEDYGTEEHVTTVWSENGTHADGVTPTKTRQATGSNPLGDAFDL